MKIQESWVSISSLRLFAHHGVMEQERKVGAYFTIDIDILTDFSKALFTDNLDGTISYADVFTIVRDEMDRPSDLLEHVAGRIAESIFKTFPQAEEIKLAIQKENPPMGADCQGAGITIHAVR